MERHKLKSSEVRRCPSGLAREALNEPATKLELGIPRRPQRGDADRCRVPGRVPGSDAAAKGADPELEGICPGMTPDSLGRRPSNPPSSGRSCARTTG